MEQLKECYNKMMECGISGDDTKCEIVHSSNCVIMSETFNYKSELHPIFSIYIGNTEPIKIFCFGKKLVSLYNNPRPNVEPELLAHEFIKPLSECNNYGYVLSYCLYAKTDFTYVLRSLSNLLQSANVAKICLPNYIIRLYLDNNIINRQDTDKDNLILKILSVGNVEIYHIVNNISEIDRTRITRYLPSIEHDIGLVIFKDIDSKLTLLECYNILLFEQSNKLLYEIQLQPTQKRNMEKNLSAYGKWLVYYRTYASIANLPSSKYLHTDEFDMMAGTTGIKYGIKSRYFIHKYMFVNDIIDNYLLFKKKLDDASQINFRALYTTLSLNESETNIIKTIYKLSSFETNDYGIDFEYDNTITELLLLMNDIKLNMGFDEIFMLELFINFANNKYAFFIEINRSLQISENLPLIIFGYHLDHQYLYHMKYLHLHKQIMNYLIMKTNNKPVYIIATDKDLLSLGMTINDYTDYRYKFNMKAMIDNDILYYESLVIEEIMALLSSSMHGGKSYKFKF